MTPDHGFQWGPMTVVRRAIGSRRRGDSTRCNYILGVETDHHELTVSVSATGRSVRVWLDGRELR